ncbi:ACT domain-containing protein [Rubrivirga sp. S365]|uniref:ACT domain-containing protein n=1 Tax=Rubrivirga litoralis TaxID=3075598 RepID=A0ABU3BVD0_9BACT|nr:MULTISPECIES: ACT domain-containing protein [unclassified Rubrivirga]MDT0633185.1 ACT domain-containing protein [Rubrivirga sp. F394]MDT7857760.1 ACT domain-containing protein [Rubrivirga sp. S365]
MPRPAPDVRALIDRIADALGGEATPERVERVARAVLEAPETAAAPPRPAPSAGRGGSESAAAGGAGRTRVVVTAYGRDTPGILAAITAELAASGANLLDVSQKILQGYFTVVLVADLDADADLGAARDRLQARGDAFGARVLLQHEDLFQAMHRP